MSGVEALGKLMANQHPEGCLALEGDGVIRAIDGGVKVIGAIGLTPKQITDILLMADPCSTEAQFHGGDGTKM